MRSSPASPAGCGTICRSRLTTLKTGTALSLSTISCSVSAERHRHSSARSTPPPSRRLLGVLHRRDQRTGPRRRRRPGRGGRPREARGGFARHVLSSIARSTQRDGFQPTSRWTTRRSRTSNPRATCSARRARLARAFTAVMDDGRAELDRRRQRPHHMTLLVACSRVSRRSTRRSTRSAARAARQPSARIVAPPTISAQPARSMPRRVACCASSAAVGRRWRASADNRRGALRARGGRRASIRC